MCYQKKNQLVSSCNLFSVHVLDVPSRPLNVRAKEVNKNYIVVTWDAPDSDGGSPITEYKVHAYVFKLFQC